MQVGAHKVVSTLDALQINEISDGEYMMNGKQKKVGALAPGASAVKANEEHANMAALKKGKAADNIVAAIG